MFNIGADVLYSLQGSNYKDGDNKLEIYSHYLKLPIYAAVNVTNKFQIHAGPFVGLLIKQDTKQVIKDFNIDKTVDTKDKGTAIDYGVVLGASYEVLENLTLEGRASLGLNGIVKDEDDKINNLGFQLSVAYSFL